MEEETPGKLASQSNASVGLVNMPSLPIVAYTSRALITAEFGEMSSGEFIDTYLAPLDVALRDSNIIGSYLSQIYD